MYIAPIGQMIEVYMMQTRSELHGLRGLMLLALLVLLLLRHR